MTREHGIYKTTLVGSAANVALLTFKFVAGFAGHSSAMIADAVHSLSDFITDLVIIVFVRISAKPQDASHDYGHGKYETFATFIVGLALVAAALGIIVSGALKMIDWAGGKPPETPGVIALWAAVVSIVGKEALYHYTVVKGKKLQSQALIANAWHHRSDALSSVGALLGIGGAIALGGRWTVLDPVASIVVGLLLVRVAVKLLGTSVGELTEESLPQEVESEIMELVQAMPGVAQPHNLRTRRIGSRIAIEMHVRIDGAVPLSEAHARATEIERCLKRRYGAGTHVIVHMEPFKQ